MVSVLGFSKRSMFKKCRKVIQEQQAFEEPYPCWKSWGNGLACSSQKELRHAFTKLWLPKRGIFECAQSAELLACGVGSGGK